VIVLQDVFFPAKAGLDTILRTSGEKGAPVMGPIQWILIVEGWCDDRGVWDDDYYVISSNDQDENREVETDDYHLFYLEWYDDFDDAISRWEEETNSEF
jgi:hypothetical protein